MTTPRPTALSGTVVPKGWGEELWLTNTSSYCAKLLRFKPNGQCSMHYHMAKDETWYVQSGSFVFTWIDGATAETVSEQLAQGSITHIPTHMPHRLRAGPTGGTIFEVSTQHFDSDSMRVSPGDSQVS